MTATLRPAWTPASGDTVVCDRLDGVFTVGGWEDDTTVWLVGPQPADAGGTFLAWLSRQRGEFLAEVSEIRPAGGAR